MNMHDEGWEGNSNLNWEAAAGKDGRRVGRGRQWRHKGIIDEGVTFYFLKKKKAHEARKKIEKKKGSKVGKEKTSFNISKAGLESQPQHMLCGLSKLS